MCAVTRPPDHPLAAVVERDFVAAWWLLAEVIDAERHDRDGVRWYHTGLAKKYLNPVLVTHLADDQADTVIDEHLARLRERGAPFVWWAMPSASPRDLGDRLRERGLVAGLLVRDVLPQHLDDDVRGQGGGRGRDVAHDLGAPVGREDRDEAVEVTPRGEHGRGLARDHRRAVGRRLHRRDVRREFLHRVGVARDGQQPLLDRLVERGLAHRGQAHERAPQIVLAVDRLLGLGQHRRVVDAFDLDARETEREPRLRDAAARAHGLDVLGQQAQQRLERGALDAADEADAEQIARVQVGGRLADDAGLAPGSDRLAVDEQRVGRDAQREELAARRGRHGGRQAIDGRARGRMVGGVERGGARRAHERARDAGGALCRFGRQASRGGHRVKV